jgi:hypothetical protein
VLLEARLVREVARRFEHDLGLQRLPRQVGRIFLLGDPDHLAVDDQRLLARLDRPLEWAVDAVVLQEQGQVPGIRKVVDGDDFKILGPFRHRAEGQPADAAKPVDPNSNGHVFLSWLVEKNSVVLRDGLACSESAAHTITSRD